MDYVFQGRAPPPRFTAMVAISLPYLPLLPPPIELNVIGPIILASSLLPLPILVVIKLQQPMGTQCPLLVMALSLQHS